MFNEEKKEQNLSHSNQLLIAPVVNREDERELLDHKTYQRTIRQALREEKIAPHLKSSWLGAEDNLVALFQNTDQLREFIEVVKTCLTTRNTDCEDEEKKFSIHRRRVCIGSSLTLMCLGGLATSGWALSCLVGTDYFSRGYNPQEYDGSFHITNEDRYFICGGLGVPLSLLITYLFAILASKGMKDCLEPGVKAAVTRKYDKQCLDSFFKIAREYNGLQSSEIGTHHRNTIGQLIFEYAA